MAVLFSKSALIIIIIIIKLSCLCDANSQLTVVIIFKTVYDFLQSFYNYEINLMVFLNILYSIGINIIIYLIFFFFN